MTGGASVSDEDHHEEWGDQPTIKFFPDHVISEATAVLVLLIVYTLLAIFIPGHLDIKSDPSMTPEGSKPEWYFLFLFALLHYVSPVVGTLAPMVGLVFLALLPWLDRNPERAASKRKFAISACLVLLAGIGYLSYIGLVA